MSRLAVVAFLVAVGRLIAQTPMPDVQALGPQVGTKVPSFTLPDQTGQPRTLESLIGPKGAILVFFRSADW